MNLPSYNKVCIYMLMPSALIYVHHSGGQLNLFEGPVVYRAYVVFVQHIEEVPADADFR